MWITISEATRCPPQGGRPPFSYHLPRAILVRIGWAACLWNPAAEHDELGCVRTRERLGAKSLPRRRHNIPRHKYAPDAEG